MFRANDQLRHFSQICITGILGTSMLAVWKQRRRDPRHQWALIRAICRGVFFAQVEILGGLALPLTMQVGGHKAASSCTGFLRFKADMLRSFSSSVVLKPLQSKGRGLRELCFYEVMADRSKRFDELKPFLCGYHGLASLAAEHANNQRYLILDDCAHRMRRPCALDLKMGTRTAEDLAPIEKQRKSLAKYPCQTEFGCRLVGMHVWCKSKRQYLKRSKVWGLSLRDDATMRQGLRSFFAGTSELKKKRQLIGDYLRKLSSLLSWFERQHHLVFISSSLLFIYDSEYHSQARSELKMIDFTHFYVGDRGDFGYTQGLRKVIRLLEDIQDEGDLY